MADPKNQGQFGNRPDTVEQASKGGNASSGKFGSPNGANPSAAGRTGAENQPREAKAEGGRNHAKTNS